MDTPARRGPNFKTQELEKMAGEILNMLGIRPGTRCRKNNARSQRGVTLIETMVASAILIIVVAGLLPVFAVGIRTTNQQGDISTRTTEYAQDKMEQLLTLSAINLSSDGYNDGTTDTTVFPSITDMSTGCTGTGANICGLGGSMAASSSIGSIPPAAPVKWFSDYLDVNGNLLASSAGAYYTRQWKVTTNAANTAKTITIAATSLLSPAASGLAPSTTLVCIKSSGL
jgi:type II secretory pathway pseudopilin PulG